MHSSAWWRLVPFLGLGVTLVSAALGSVNPESPGRERLIRVEPFRRDPADPPVLSSRESHGDIKGTTQRPPGFAPGLYISGVGDLDALMSSRCH